MTELKRSQDLPDYRLPPLNEVVLGVQFGVPNGYQQIYAGEVWGLYRDKFPRVQETVPLQPTVETFGTSLQAPMAGHSFGLVSGATHDRFWFLNQPGTQLIQFQNDRLLHNWRKSEGSNEPYPRFESMSRAFRSEIESLQKYMQSRDPKVLAIYQCEISYVNHILLDSKSGTSVAKWLKFLSLPEYEPDDFQIVSRSVLKDNIGSPWGRLYVESVAGYAPGGQRIINLSLTAKGAPRSSSIDDALEFIARGREVIVRRITQLTTDAAHIAWGRIK